VDTETPFQWLGGEAEVAALANAFYDAMEAHEPELTAVHRCATPGKVDPVVRERFSLFLIGWLGGPQHYVEQHGHPRLRMRHAHVQVDATMRDAWLRSMTRAMDARSVSGQARAYLDARFADVANFLRNVDE